MHDPDMAVKQEGSPGKRIPLFLKKHWLFFLLAVLPSLFLINQGFGRYGSFFIDCGRDAVIPWRLLDGEVLYRDVRYVYGPLAPYLNLLLFRLFGIHLTTLYLAGAATFFMVLCLVYSIACFFTKRGYAALIASFFAFQLGLKQLHGSDVFNFIFPYSFALIYGTACALWLVLFTLKYLERSSDLFLLSASLGLTGALLSKGELALACLAYYLIFLIVAYVMRRGRPDFSAIRFLAASLICPLLCTMAVLSYFMGKLNVRAFLDQHIFFHNAIWRGYMRGVSGFDAAGTSLGEIVSRGGVYLLFLSLIISLSYLLKKNKRWIAVVLITVPVLAYLFGEVVDFRKQYFALPLIFVLALLLIVHDFLKGKRPYPLLLFLVFTLLFTWRRFLNCSTQHISFCLLIPGMIFYYIFFLQLFSERLKRSFAVWPVAFFILTLGALNAYRAMVFTSYIFDVKQNEIRTSRGAIQVDIETFRTVDPMLKFLKARLGPEDELIVFPEGPLINFLSGAGNRLYNIAFTPPEVAYRGAETSIIDYLDGHETACVCIVGRRTDEYGFPVFGQDYLQGLSRYLSAHYRTVTAFGGPLFSRQKLGAVILIRK